MAIIGIYKPNEIQMIGGTTPQGEKVSLAGNIKDWHVVIIEDENEISAYQEFNIQPVYDGFAEAINGPQQEGAYNAPAYTIEGSGDKMRFENNPDQLGEDGLPLTSPDDLDDRSQKNFTAEDVKSYKEAYSFIKKYEAKSILRNNIRGNIKDIEDDIADIKVALQFALYYMAYEWNSRTEAEKYSNPKREGMDKLANKLLSDKTKLRADLKNGLEKITEIISTEAKINKLVKEKYKYDSSRGV